MKAFARSVCHHLFNTYEKSAIQTTTHRLAEAGFDAIELLGEPSFYPDDVAAIIRRSGLRVTSLTAASRISTGRDLVHKDRSVRANTREHIARCAAFAEELDCRFVGVSLTAVGRMVRDEDLAGELRRIDEALDWLDELGAATGITFSLEILNRYSSAYLNTVSDEGEIEWRRPNVGVTLDSFHLLTEVCALSDVELWAERTTNIQVSGGARGTVSRSLIDPGLFVSALANAGYRGPVTLEAFPSTTPFADIRAGELNELWTMADEFITWCEAWSERWESCGLGGTPVNTRADETSGQHRGHHLSARNA